MFGMKHKLQIKPLLKSRAMATLLVIVLAVGIAQSSLFRAQAALLSARSLELSTSSTNATNVTYTFRFTLATAATLGSIVFELCTNDPFPLTPCSAPAGLDMSAAVLATQIGETGFSIDASSTANKIVLTRAPSASATIPVTYSFNGIKNPSFLGTFYGRLVTYATNDASGSDTDQAGVASATTNNFSLNTEVPQFLEFCSGITITNFDCLTATGSNIDFGNFSPSIASAATSQFVAATNAGFGYNVGIYGLTMTSGTNTLPNLALQTFSAPGNSQFGINLVANTLPVSGSNPVGPGVAGINPSYATSDLYRFNSGDQVVSSIGSSDYRKFTVSYIANISSIQPVGHYSTTLTYICLANF